jgi:glycosyltransferase involved in cell wall biosynthesis
MNSIEQPLVTVIIPTYNRAHSILRAIESVLKQTYSNIQLIVVDDGSVDDTATKISHIPSIHYIYQQHGGQARARNSGLHAAQGLYIASLDSDDYWCSEFLENSMEALLGNELDFVFSNWNQQFGPDEWVDAFSKYHSLRSYITGHDQFWHFLGPSELKQLFFSFCPSPSSSMVIRRSSIINGWNEHMNIGDDWFLQMDIISNKPCKAAFTLERLWHKCQDDINICDGRDPMEVIQLLYVDDTAKMISRFNGLITSEELRALTKFQITGLMELARHSLIHKMEIKSTWTFFWRSFRIQPLATISAIPRLFLSPVKENLKLAIEFNFPQRLKIIPLEQPE